MEKLKCAACGHPNAAEPFPEKCANCGCKFGRLKVPPPHPAAERLRAVRASDDAQKKGLVPGQAGLPHTRGRDEPPLPDVQLMLDEPSGPVPEGPARLEVVVRGEGAAAKFRQWAEKEGGHICLFVSVPNNFDPLSDEQTVYTAEM